MTPIERRTMFHFSDYLGRLPGSFVYERFLKRCGPERKIVSASTIQDIRTRFASEKNLNDAFARLSKDAQFAVSLAYLFGEQGVSCEGLLPNTRKSISGIEKYGTGSNSKRDAFSGFDDECIGSFLVYAAESPDGKKYYVGFEEFEPKLRGLFCKTIAERTKTRSDKEARQTAPGFCVNDVAAVVSLAAQGKLTKTKIGQIGKAAEQLTAKLLHGGKPPFDWIAGRTRPLTFLVEYAGRKGLISLHGDHYLPDHGRMCAWMARQPGELHADILEFAFSWLPVWRKTMVDELFSGRENPWLSGTAFGEGLTDSLSPNVKVLAYLGLLEYQKSSGDLLFRASRPGIAGKDAVKPGHAPRVMILPDFTAMLPQETAPSNLYWFARIGLLESLDKVYKGKIDREVIYDSLSAGIQGAAVLELLEEWHASANIVETVREWIREFSQVFMESGAIVVSAEEKVTKRLGSYGLLAGCIEPVRAHCIFRVAKGKEDLVAGILKSMGFDHRAPVIQCHERSAEHVTLSALMLQNNVAGAALSPIVNFEKLPEAPPLVIQQGKYSSQLKALEITEIMHVIEYSLLMGNRLRIEYGGSPGIRKGVYQIRPLRYEKGPGSGLEAESGRACSKKTFLLDRIVKIGVEPLHE